MAYDTWISLALHLQSRDCDSSKNNDKNSDNDNKNSNENKDRNDNCEINASPSWPLIKKKLEEWESHDPFRVKLLKFYKDQIENLFHI